MNYKYVLVLGIILCFALSAFAQEQTAYYVTFGENCPTSWGDDDYNQIFFIALQSDSDPFYLWIYDPDCGGNLDEENAGWNTETRFSLYGGVGAFTNEDARSVNPTSGLTAGTLLQEETFGNDSARDNNWTVWGPFSPEQGELIGGENIFKLSVIGISGNDGNLYKLFLSNSEVQRNELETARFFSHEITFQLPSTTNRSTVLNLLPEDQISQITIYNFDGDNQGGITLNTPARTGLAIEISGNDEWAKTTYNLSENERIGEFSINLGKASPGNNDIVFMQKTPTGKPFPSNCRSPFPNLRRLLPNR
jgi:hypothetical protein